MVFYHLPGISVRHKNEIIMKLTYLFKLHFIIGLVLANNSFGQYAAFIYEGSIQYERRFNQYSIFDTEQTWGRNYRETEPQFRNDLFTLDFSVAASLYKPNSAIPISKSFYLALPANDNIVYKNHGSKEILTQKKIMENVFLVRSASGDIRWKITSETRTIAGLECKRANAIILDSIFVVAYYSEQIPVSSGPESFSGLPGMILGLAIPDIHMTWFATKVFTRPVTIKDPTREINNKVMLPAEIKSLLQGAFRDHGKFASIFSTAAIL
jgi:GLPGLI family protein